MNTTKPFKSARAAKIAYTKAEKAWEAKRSEGFAARDEIRIGMRHNGGTMPSDEYNTLKATEDRCEAEAAVLFEKMRLIYNKAEAEGHFIKSWHFGHNPTRDLIAANMD